MKRTELVFKPIVCRAFHESRIANCKRAELLQEVHTVVSYGSGNGLFSAEEFANGSQTFSRTEKRLVWVDVPLDASAEEVEARISAHPKARISSTLHSHPILSPGMERAVGEGRLELDTVALRQILTGFDADGNPNRLYIDGRLRPIYRVYRLSLEGEADRDLTSSKAEDYYVPSVYLSLLEEARRERAKLKAEREAATKAADQLVIDELAARAQSLPRRKPVEPRLP